MKKIYCIFLALVALAAVNFGAPKAKIITEAVTPRTLPTYAAQNSISPGLYVVAKGTYSYLSPLNIGDATAITSVTWTLVTKPSGSNATLTTLPNNWVTFKADTNGTYTVGLNMVTSSGTHDTTINITSSYYVGVGNFEGVTATWPQCMSCHAGTPKFAAIFDKWKVSNHAQIFKTEIVAVGGHYSPSCMPCHTTGYDNKVVANNNGFDDLAKQLGWTWSPETAGKWDSLKTYFPTLVNHATIGCETCHGAGKEHGTTTDKTKIQISLDAGVCQSCHDAPWRHSIGTQYEYSGHSVAVWSNSFAQGTTSQNNTLANCIRCHDAKGFINFTNNVITNTTGWTIGNHAVISCQTCHDPHNGDLRDGPSVGDTLGNGYNYGSFGGEGNLCINCHKARRDNVAYMTTNLSSSWGPHHSVQADIFMGKNAAEFGTSYPSGTHKFSLTNACVDCHMSATTDTGTVTRDKVGGHSWNLHFADTDYDHTTKCQGCHGPITHFSDFVAAMDYDGDETIESLQDEVKGMIYNVKFLLPHTGVGDTIKVNWQDSTFNTNLLKKKAYWNLQLVEYDGSFGMHNAKYTVAVLQKTIAVLTGSVPVELIAFNASASGNNAIITWETSTETNNKGFDIERKTGKDFVKIAFVSGKGTTTEASAYSYSDKLNNVADGKIVYRLKQIDFDGKITYSKEVTVNYTGGPRSYTLSQNYPNPFNPSTVIKFALPYSSSVKLTVYNIAGQEVKVLVNGVKSAGTHDVSFNLREGSNLSSGVYFYSLEAKAVDGSSSFRETKKMILMK